MKRVAMATPGRCRLGRWKKLFPLPHGFAALRRRKGKCMIFLLGFIPGHARELERVGQRSRSGQCRATRQAGLQSLERFVVAIRLYAELSVGVRKAAKSRKIKTVLTSQSVVIVIAGFCTVKGK